jgi:pyrroline-5-carboxylate reductase
MKTGFVGGGKMAEAIIASFLRARALRRDQIFASDLSDKRRRWLRGKYRITTYARNGDVFRSARIVFLAVKPQDLGAVLTQVAPMVGGRHLVVSIAAGRPLSAIESELPQARVVRVMPNLPCLVSEGMSVFCAGKSATATDKRIVARLLSVFGRTLELPEDQFDAVTALSGSGPAFFAYILNCLVDAAVLEGMSRGDAVFLTEQTMYGTARLLMETDMDPLDLIKSVTSPKGTTASGLDVLNHSSVARVLRRTIGAAVRRSRDLSHGAQ